MLETSAGKREEIQVANGGFARVTALINELANREKCNQNSLGRCHYW